MTFLEIDFDKAVWTIPASRMKMARQHEVPLSDQAVAILRAQEAERGRNPHVFAGQRPRQPLSHMSMAMILRRRGVGVTVHGMRSSARSWMADDWSAVRAGRGRLAHQVGNAVVQAYQRSSMLERRRPVLTAWATFVTGPSGEQRGADQAWRGVIRIAISSSRVRRHRGYAAARERRVREQDRRAPRALSSYGRGWSLST